jgi:type II secretory pathway pseudopilin PulG
MIELLLVIGILIVLITMFFVGLNYVTATLRARDTRTMLETAKTMFNEYQQATHLARTPVGLTNANWTWTYTESLPAAPPWAIGPLTPGSSAWTNANITLGVDTAAVMYALEQMPANQAIMNNIPSSKKLTVPFQYTDAPPNTYVTFLLDSWGNPILFVPSGGLANVRFGGQTSSVTGQSAVGTTATAGGTESLITSPDSTQFFVSPGPDGDVSQGDDNVYSFQ